MFIDLQNQITPQLQIFEDSFRAFIDFADLFEGLAKLDNTNPSEDDIIELLNSLKFKDITKYNQPEPEEYEIDEERGDVCVRCGSPIDHSDPHMYCSKCT